nr:hypothetical protein [Tanacetum cinerariifolium]
TSVPLDIGADEVVHQEGGDSVERVITTDPSLVAARDSDNITKTQSMAMGNVSKQGRDESNKIEELNLSDKESGETEVFDYTIAAEKDVNAAEPVSAAGDAVNAASVILDVSAAGPSTSTVGPSTC